MNLEVSDPKWESDHLRHITVKSPALKGRADITVYVPEEQATELPIVLLLHGVYGSHSSWTRQGGAHKAAAGRAMILAMPSDGLWHDGSGYVPHKDGPDFEKWIIDDAVEAVIQAIPQASLASPVFICGLSMGGYGALRLGAKYPRAFQGISAHSSITDLSQMKLFADHVPETRDEPSVLKWMLKNKAELPPLRFDCGVDDLLIEHNRELDRQLSANGIAHKYEEFRGGHSWDYWHEHLKDTLDFFEECLKK